MNRNQNSVGPVLRRWTDMICLTIIAVLISIILFPLFKKFAILFTSLIIIWPDWIQLSIRIFIISCIWFVMIRLGAFRFNDFISLRAFRYPPVWMFGILGTIIYLWIIYSSNNCHIVLNFKTCGINVGLVVFGLFIAFILTNLLGWIEKQSNKNTDETHNKTVSFKTIIDNPRELCMWIEEESPIKYPWQDLFGLSTIARRISRIVTDTHLKTIGVVGIYGCGKTSLLNLVEYDLDSENLTEHPHTSGQKFKGDILICRVDGWGRTHGSIAQQILSISVNSLKSKVDCLSIINVPANYIKTLQGLKNTWTTIITQ